MADPTSDLVVTDDLTIPATELHWRFSRSSGPGGQSVNTSDSRVELRWDPATSHVLTGTSATAAHARSPSSPPSTARSCRTGRPPATGWRRRVESALAAERKRRRRTRPAAPRS